MPGPRSPRCSTRLSTQTCSSSMYDLGPMSAQLPDRKTGKKPGRMSVGEIKLSVPESSSCKRTKRANVLLICYVPGHMAGSKLAYEFGGGRGDACAAGAVADGREVVPRRLAADWRGAPAPAATRRGLQLHSPAHGSSPPPLLCWRRERQHRKTKAFQKRKRGASIASATAPPCTRRTVSNLIF